MFLLAGLCPTGNVALILLNGSALIPFTPGPSIETPGRAVTSVEQQPHERASERVPHDDRRLVVRLDHLGEVVDDLAHAQSRERRRMFPIASTPASPGSIPR